MSGRVHPVGGRLVLVAVLLGGSLLPLRGQAADEPTEQQRRDQEKKAAELNSRGLALYRRGQYREATTLLREALAMRRALYPRGELPRGHPGLATSLNSLGAVLQAQGEYAKAEPLYREALA